ncbi:hypothetical protein QFC22_006590 [Naganishia vaughanmartiniae]|uniref:Uncharacterized protein n=1 Tax=Naganishia vaughanmartiniae TaxID=1424756 RepID=A0ACC2WIP6_9TREE|nr:hypothetical protein QFC22_006590 [Naganishia vaughanmartiniae]
MSTSTSYNRLAVYGHRGWASSAISKALIDSGAHVKVLYRPSSDVSDLPKRDNVSTFEVNVDDEAQVLEALNDVDILISLVGHEGVERQHAFVEALPKTSVKLFVPSDLAARYDEQGLRVPVNAAKDKVEKRAKELGIPLTIVLPGNFAEFALSTIAMGVDCVGNQIILSGDMVKQPLNLCTKDYVASGYASLFASTPIDDLSQRVIALSEFQVTGEDLIASLTEKHGFPTRVVNTLAIEQVDRLIEEKLEAGDRSTLAYYCRKIWGTGQQVKMIGEDVWTVPGYQKQTQKALLVDGELKPYRSLSQEFIDHFAHEFE